jgi:hypothetical protein
VKSIRILGKAATAGVANSNHGNWRAADLYSGGGSGHVIAGYHVTPLDGIQRRADISGIKVLDDDSQEEADVTIVVAGTTSAEAADRSSLHLDDDADNLIFSTASTSQCSGYCSSTGCGWTAQWSCPWAPNPGSKGRAGNDGSTGYKCCCEDRSQEDQPCGASTPSTSKKVVVLLQVPGAILTPWKDSVHAIATMFLGGQETGNAWAAVLFGDHAPTGHLPISMPATEADTIEPSTSSTITYSEGLSIGYRNKQFGYAFAFGHGITYTNFTYSNGVARSCGESACVDFKLQNIGHESAATVPQLYLELPAAAKQPSPILKGFAKTSQIHPGDSVTLTFQLSKGDFAYWDSGSWEHATSATAHIGASSADIRLSMPIKLASSQSVVVV